MLTYYNPRSLNMAVRSTTGSWGREISTHRYLKRLVRVRQRIPNIPRLLVIDQRNVTEDRVDNVEHKDNCVELTDICCRIISEDMIVTLYKKESGWKKLCKIITP